MGKRDKKKIRHSGAEAPKAGPQTEPRVWPKAAPRAKEQQQSPDSGEPIGSRRLVVWSIAAVVVIVAAVAAWSLLRDGSSPAVATTEIHQPADPVPSPAAGQVVGEVSPDTGMSDARLEIPEPEFDFGFVPQKAKVSHVFWLHSAGTDTLRILKVNPG